MIQESVMEERRYYKGLIWTDHALQRLTDRQISQEQAWKAFSYPQRTRMSKEQDATEFMRRFGKVAVTVVAKKNENFEWVVLTCWRDPPVPGTEDYVRQQEYREYLKASIGKKILIKIIQWLKRIFG